MRVLNTECFLASAAETTEEMPRTLGEIVRGSRASAESFLPLVSSCLYGIGDVSAGWVDVRSTLLIIYIVGYKDHDAKPL